MRKELIQILLVDDDAGDRRLIEQMLRRPSGPSEFTVSTARSLAECFRFLRATEYDLILLDLSLPDSTGVETVERVCEVCGRAAVVVLTGLADEETGLEAIRKGAIDYLIKGELSKDALLRSIRYSFQHKATREELIRQRTSMEAIFEASPVGMLLIDDSGTVKRINNVAAKLAGKARAEMIDVQPGGALNCIHARDDPEGCGHGPVCSSCPIRRALGNVLVSGKAVCGLETQVTLVIGGTDTDLWVEINAEPVMLDGKRCAIASIANITPRKEAEQQAREAMARAEEANAAKSTFLANMSHEIRTPMTAILGFAEELKDPTITASDRHNYLAIIQHNGEFLLDLINDILDLSKIESGRLDIERVRVSLTSLIADVASLMMARAGEKGISFSVEYAGQVPETIITDPVRLRQALVNLVGNAVKFTEEGGVRVAVSFVPRWREQTAAIEIQVIDTGVGMTGEKLEWIFEPFVQADPSTSRKHGGTGLGLAITRNIAELLGGELTVVSQPGRGSTFTLTVPAGSLEGVRMIENPTNAVQGGSDIGAESGTDDKPLSGLRILLAEDGPDSRLLFTALLRRAGAEVEVARNGRIAVDKVHAGEGYDAILMDMQMPEMDGYEATRVLRERGLTCPIIALTAHAMAGDMERCLAAGCTDYCSKPINRVALIATIARHAAGADGPRQAQGPRIDPLRSQFADDGDLAEALDGFLDALPSRLEAMRQALANNHYEQLRRLSHQLKGAGGGYGYPLLTEEARKLENAAGTEDAEAANLAMGRLEHLCRRIACGRSRAVSAEGEA